MINSSLIKIARLDKPWGMVLLAWPTCSALLLTHTKDFKTWIVFSLGIILTRSAGCVINDYADQWLDGQIDRTKNRPLVSKELSSSHALCWFMLLMLSSASLLWFLNDDARLLAVLSAGLICIYPYTKRFLLSPQAFLGIVFSMGIPMAYANAGYPYDPQFWGLFLITAYWVVVYDTLYAMADQKDDQKTGVKSMALTLGQYAKGFVKISYVLIWLAWSIWGSALSWPFYISLMLLGWNYYQQVLDMKNEAYFKAFLRNQMAGLWIFLGVLFSQLWSGL